jgi:hypothetical protein
MVRIILVTNKYVLDITAQIKDLRHVFLEE